MTPPKLFGLLCLVVALFALTRGGGWPVTQTVVALSTGFLGVLLLAPRRRREAGEDSSPFARLRRARKGAIKKVALS